MACSRVIFMACSRVIFKQLMMKGGEVSRHAMKTCRKAEVHLHQFLISAINESEWATSRPGCFIPGKERLNPLNKTLGGPLDRSGRYGEEKNI